MFSSNKNIEIIRQLIEDLRQYGELRIEHLQLDIVSKMTILISSLIMGAILFVLVTIVVLLLSWMAALMLSPYVGGTVAGCGIIALFYTMICVVVYRYRRALIIDPMANFLGNLFLSPEKKTKKR